MRAVFCSILKALYFVLHLGLLVEHVPEAGVLVSPPHLHSPSEQDHPIPPGRRNVEEDLDPGHVLPQRKARHFPRGHRRESSAATERHRSSVVRHQVRRTYTRTFLISRSVIVSGTRPRNGGFRGFPLIL